jgi:hypothetical protein
MRIKLYVSQIEDPYIRANFLSMGQLFQGTPFLKGEWKFLELSITSTGTVKIPHTLAFTPKDVILLSQVGGTVTFNYNLFDSTYLNVTATVTASPMVIRVFVGRYTEESVNV